MRIGIDLGGTKIEGLALNDAGEELVRLRKPTPRGEYDGSLQVIQQIVAEVELHNGLRGTVGVGIPGTIAVDGLVKNANSTWLNGHAIDRDLSTLLQREVRCANDANCFAVSEAVDGAGAGFGTVFGVIAGTGCGGGLALGGRVHPGRNGLGGEWGHTPLPWPAPDEYPGRPCYCGRHGCLETWISSPAFERDFSEATGRHATGKEIAAAAQTGDEPALKALERLADRMARGLAVIVDIVDPEVIVLGGGVSNIEWIYPKIEAALAGPHLRSSHGHTHPPGHPRRFQRCTRSRLALASLARDYRRRSAITPRAESNTEVPSMQIWSLNGARFVGETPQDVGGPLRWLRSLSEPGAELPDVLCLQDFRASLLHLLRPLPYFCFMPMTNHWCWGVREELGILIASRFPMTAIDVHLAWGDGQVRDLEGVDTNNRRISPPELSDELILRTENRIAIACTITPHGSSVGTRIATHHGFWTRDGIPTEQQMASTRSVAAFLAGQGCRHGGIVYMADFNPDREGRARDIYLASGARDWLPPGVQTTLAADHPAASLGVKADCILTWPAQDRREGYRILRTWLDATPQSDHLMLRCEVCHATH